MNPVVWLYVFAVVVIVAAILSDRDPWWPR